MSGSITTSLKTNGQAVTYTDTCAARKNGANATESMIDGANYPIAAGLKSVPKWSIAAHAWGTGKQTPSWARTINPSCSVSPNASRASPCLEKYPNEQHRLFASKQC